MANVKVDDTLYKSASFESLTAGITYEDPRFHLNLVQKKELPSERPIINTTRAERLAFYRAVTSTPSKMEIIATQQMQINQFLWFYSCNVFFKTLPHSFVHFFLASYSPEEHMFVTKMVPFSYGLKFLFVMTGFFELCSIMDMILMISVYTIDGPLNKSPWNRCRNITYHDEFVDKPITCYQIEEFGKKFINATKMKYLDFSFIDDNEEHFQVSQIEYYKKQILRIGVNKDIPLFIFWWALLQLFLWYATRRSFWKTLHISQWILMSMEITIFVYLTIEFYNTVRDFPIARVPQYLQNKTRSFWSSDIELLAESITAPPIVHVLTSRSTQEINPTRDSSLMVFSNAMVYILRGLLSNKVKMHCQNRINTELPVTQFNQHPSFYIWTMFFSRFYLGGFYSVIFMMLNLIIEFHSIVVVYLCLAESVTYEWPKIKRWMIVLAVSAAGILMHIFMDVDGRCILWAFGKGISTFAETFYIYTMYPVGRLVDDFTFHYGSAPTKLRILSLRLVPVYYIVKLYLMMDALWSGLTGLHINEFSYFLWSWVLMILPVIFGSMYIVYKYLIVYRMTWIYILRPYPKWGPRDFSVRQLRKQYDSRYYIGSEVPRLLSRYLASKRDSKVYKVDVRYDFARRSTVRAVGMDAVRFREEKKEK